MVAFIDAGRWWLCLCSHSALWPVICLQREGSFFSASQGRLRPRWNQGNPLISYTTNTPRSYFDAWNKKIQPRSYCDVWNKEIHWFHIRRTHHDVENRSNVTILLWRLEQENPLISYTTNTPRSYCDAWNKSKRRPLKIGSYCDAWTQSKRRLLKIGAKSRWAHESRFERRRTWGHLASLPTALLAVLRGQILVKSDFETSVRLCRFSYRCPDVYYLINCSAAWLAS